MIKLPDNLRYLFLIISIVFGIFFILTFPKKLIKKYTIDTGYIYMTAYAFSWVALLFAYYVLLKIFKN
jgi:hypothetical protein